jgi:bacteriorhodopsin
METISDGGYLVVYNVLSLGIASMLFTTIFLFIAKDRVLPKYRMAIMVSATVTGIAAYHYFRMFDNFIEVFGPEAVEGATFNVGYRYVDWFLTVPLLLVETIAVLALAAAVQRSLLVRLIPAAALMIALGYPGDARLNLLYEGDASLWGLFSTIPFLYILYVLFVELGKSLERQSAPVQRRLKELRLLLLATWGVYPIAFIFNMGAVESETGFIAREVGYSVADILAKCLFGLMIFSIARMKSAEDDAEFAKVENREHA